MDSEAPRLQGNADIGPDESGETKLYSRIIPLITLRNNKKIGIKYI